MSETEVDTIKIYPTPFTWLLVESTGIVTEEFRVISLPVEVSVIVKSVVASPASMK